MMQPRSSKARPLFKLRCWQAVAFFCVFLPGGHIVLPQCVAFLRFLNPGSAPSGVEYVILGCACGGVVASFLPFRRAALLLDVIAGLLFLGVLVLVQWKWADPFDLGMVLLTAAPWAIMTTILIICDAYDTSPAVPGCCPKCNYDCSGLAAGAICPECGLPNASTPP
jgi:hypothetical protein